MKIKLDKKQLMEVKQAANMYYVNSDAGKRGLDSDEFISFCWVKALEQVIKRNNPDLEIELKNG